MALNAAKAGLFATSTPISVNLPLLIQEGNSSRSDALIYTSIKTLDEGTDPQGRVVGDGRSWALPAPIDIIDLHSASYEGINFAESKIVQQAMKNGGGVAGGLLQGGISLAKGVLKSLYPSPGSESLLGTKAAVGTGAIYNQYSTATRTGINPNTELAYRGPNLRQIQLSFRITPFSSQDADSLYKFISYMREMIYPITNDTIWGMGYPAQFAISVNVIGSGSVWSNKKIFSMGHGTRKILGGMQEGNQQTACVLTDMQVSYGELGTYAGHFDGSPSIANITMSFQENLVSTRETIKEEYNH